MEVIVFGNSELFLHIADYLSYRDLLNLECVNKRTKQFVDDEFWRCRLYNDGFDKRFQNPKCAYVTFHRCLDDMSCLVDYVTAIDRDTVLVDRLVDFVIGGKLRDVAASIAEKLSRRGCCRAALYPITSHDSGLLTNKHDHCCILDRLAQAFRKYIANAILNGAAAGGHWMLIYAAAQLNASVSSRTITEATRAGRRDIVKLLLSYPIRIGSVLQHINTALVEASRCGYLDIVGDMIEHGADMFGGALKVAVESGHKLIVNELLHDPRELIRYHDVYEAIYLATLSGDIGMANALMNSDKVLKLCVHIDAIRTGNVDVIHALFDARVNLFSCIVAAKLQPKIVGKFINNECDFACLFVHISDQVRKQHDALDETSM